MRDILRVIFVVYVIGMIIVGVGAIIVFGIVCIVGIIYSLYKEVKTQNEKHRLHLQKIEERKLKEKQLKEERKKQLLKEQRLREKQLKQKRIKQKRIKRLCKDIRLIMIQKENHE